MNDFKESLIVDKIESKVKTEKNKKEILDEKISANIAKILSDMSINSEDVNEKIQILDRMLIINRMFENGFDKQAKILKKAEKNELYKDNI